jgi:hypothetical protein
MARDSISGLWVPMRVRSEASRAAHAVPTRRCETTGLDKGHCAQRGHQPGSAQVRSICLVRQDDGDAVAAKAARPLVRRRRSSTRTEATANATSNGPKIAITPSPVYSTVPPLRASIHRQLGIASDA